MQASSILVMNILFLCVANSARSQMAEGLAKEILGEGHNIKSAGSNPSGVVNPYAIKVLNEVDIDISSYTSKSVDKLEKNFISNLDYVITLCAEEACPMYITHADKLHWINEDPDNKDYSKKDALLAFRKTRSDIYNSLKKFKLEILSAE
jgi:arsenate reductase (thioredoxin)